MKRTQDLLAQLTADFTSGSTQLLLLAIGIFKIQYSETEGLDLRRLRASLKETGCAIVRAHPAMAALFNLANRTLWIAEEARSADDLRKTLSWAMEQYERAVHQDQSALSKNALSLLPHEGRIVTISFSSAVLEALKTAHIQGKRIEIVCAESRPLCEGVEMVKQLGQMGVPCELVVDALAPSRVEQAELVLVGGDGVTTQNLINKIGTYALALAARWHHVPCVALVARQKFFPPDLEIHLPKMDAREVFASSLANARITNTYFEKVPLTLISTLMTEVGPTNRRAITRLIRSVRTHPSLKQIL